MNAGGGAVAGRSRPNRSLPNRPLFVAVIFTGSFLLFLVQPMVARMVLPLLGGAPNVWNSAMLVYQALLLAGYGYAHGLSKMPLRRQHLVHLVLLAAATLTLPIGVADLPMPSASDAIWWVPLLFAVSVGPVFLLVSAQAPLMQRWYAADPGAGEPWALYAASNIGSFLGLIAYPLVLEPLLSLRAQSLVWSGGYILLIALVALAGTTRRGLTVRHESASELSLGPLGWRRILLWLALSAVPSGLMLSTTTHLTTDIFAMPLLWVIPLGLYLLSFVLAFADRRGPANFISTLAPIVLLLAGAFAMVSHQSGTLTLALSSVLLLFVVAVALHSRLYASRPPVAQLTLFYFVMSAGGALGGVFTALIAPLIFDWVWEHPILVLLAATLLPMPRAIDWTRLPGLDLWVARAGAAALLIFALLLSAGLLADEAFDESAGRLYLTVGIALAGTLLLPWRPAFVAVLFAAMVAQGGLLTAWDTLAGSRTRSYFGIYTVRDHDDTRLRMLSHGTTLHGQQSLDPAHARDIMTYYGPTSGAGLVFRRVPAFYGPTARIGVVGLGTGTLACYKRPGESWRFFEIDPAVLKLSRNGTFTYVELCAPDAQVAIGDARIKLAKVAPGSLDLLVVDAFSSDAIPLHLLTDEAFAVYFRALSPKGLLLVHISNRYIELEPVLAAIARHRNLALAKRDDAPQGNDLLTSSSWVAMTRDPALLGTLTRASPKSPWTPLLVAAPRPWTDDHASILPYVRWHNFLGKH